jgi:hypothetical protein
MRTFATSSGQQTTVLTAPARAPATRDGSAPFPFAVGLLADTAEGGVVAGGLLLDNIFSAFNIALYF